MGMPRRRNRGYGRPRSHHLLGRPSESIDVKIDREIRTFDVFASMLPCFPAWIDATCDALFSLKDLSVNVGSKMQSIKLGFKQLSSCGRESSATNKSEHECCIERDLRLRAWAPGTSSLSNKCWDR